MAAESTDTGTVTAPVTACVIIIGNEILSGRTQDTNLAWLGKELTALGIRLAEARVIPDVPAVIVDTVNACRAAHDYVFTTGGIGPTHDDITAECVARAFGVPLLQNPEALRRLQAHYANSDIELNEARLRMANAPEGATLIDNPVSTAPGFQIGNVFVMAGVPRIMQAMFEGLRHRLVGGAPLLSRTIGCTLPEGAVAKDLGAVQAEMPGVEIGSYPYYSRSRFGTNLVVRSTDPALLDRAVDRVCAAVRRLGGEPEVREGEAG
jgi:molybdenum cofactor synthesis domain-containing protein